MSRTKNQDLKTIRVNFPRSLYKAFYDEAKKQDKNMSMLLRELAAKESNWAGKTRDMNNYEEI